MASLALREAPIGAVVTIPTRMKIYNTRGRTLEDFLPREAGKVAMYVCGATVQARPHFGHGRYAVVFDVVRSYLEWHGYEVTYVRNITDVDDKIIAAASERSVSIDVVVQEAAEAFAAAYDALGVRVADVEPKATEHIAEMITMIEQLIQGDHAYESAGDVYFAVRSFDRYGALSGRNVDELLSGARIEPVEAKRDPLDFALWKAAKPGEPTWDSPWGPGRPGWHIECSAMAQKYLGFSFDIHGGGNDLVFPHHENEVAQAEAAIGDSPFATYWMHNGMLTLSGEKMAKSTGHVVDLLDAIEKYPGLAVRLFYLRTHYRKPLDFSIEALEDATGSLERLWAFRRRVPGAVEASPDADLLNAFRSAMDDDFDVAGALAVIFELVREGNRRLDAGEGVEALAATYDELVGLLGLLEPIISLDDLAAALAELGSDVGVDAGGVDIDALLDRRETARNEQDWAVSDQIRDGLAEIGIIVEDTADGARWYRR